MSFADERSANRQLFFDAWKKFNEHQALEGIEQQIVNVIINHPEYQYAVEDSDGVHLDKIKPEHLEVNPFMHFALHMAVADLLKSNEPQGIRKAYADLLAITDNPHQTDHYFMELLAHEMHEAYNENRQLNIKAILSGVDELIKKL